MHHNLVFLISGNMYVFRSSEEFCSAMKRLVSCADTPHDKWMELIVARGSHDVTGSIRGLYHSKCILSRAGFWVPTLSYCHSVASMSDLLRISQCECIISFTYSFSRPLLQNLSSSQSALMTMVKSPEFLLPELAPHGIQIQSPLGLRI